MASLGNTTLIMTLVIALYSILASLSGHYYKSNQLTKSGLNATFLTPILLGISTASLVTAFVTNNFGIQYVAEHSNLSMEKQYIWVAFYAGNEGSLLFIAFALAVLSAIAIFFSPSQNEHSIPHINSVLMIILIFFVGVMIFLANPFALSQTIPPDGKGINPLLTHPGMFIHPPVLMTGLISFSVPFSIAMGSLLAGKIEDQWVDSGRVWGIICWGMLGIGLLLGSWWAYTILGWGGYWAWDPVENAGFMPWIVMTAFIHSIMVQKRRGMFRMWNMVLIILAFAFAQFGMFINRGGPVPSVHSFGASTLGWIFLMFMIVTVLISFAIFFIRYNAMKSSSKLESALSREASFLVNNLLFLTVAFVTLWGVIYPLISELTQGQTITVGQPFYNQVNGPIFLMIILLMGIAPFLPWRHTTLANILKSIYVPILGASSMTLLLIISGVTKIFPLIAFALCAFVITGILKEWIRGTLVRRKRGENTITAFTRLIAGNKPRYGGYVAHLAVIFLCLGVAGSSFYGIQEDVPMVPGEKFSLEEYTIEYVGFENIKNPDRTQTKAEIRVMKNGEFLGTYFPRRDFYPNFNMASTQAAIRSTFIEDLYIIPGEVLEDGNAIFRVLINPLVIWMWIAGPVLILAVLITLWPEKRRIDNSDFT